MLILKTFFTGILLCTATLAYCQANDTLLARLLINLRNSYNLNPQEKCLLQTDKSFYQPGETIWFKSSLLLNGNPTTLSKVIYSDLSDATGRIYHKGIWKAENGSAAGSYYLSDTIRTGIYRLRSYSLWMLNQPSAIAVQYVFVLGKKDQTKSYTVANSEHLVDFSPEGGNLVNGVTNRVTFKSFRADGLAMQKFHSIKLVDNNNNTVAVPLFFYDCLGLLEFIPEKNKSYKLVFQTGVNYSESFSLPVAKDEGLVLKVNNLTASKIFIAAEASASFGNRNKIITILAQQNGKPVLVSKFNLEEQQNATVLNKKNLSNGLLQITAFDEHLNPLAERWILVEQVSLASLKWGNISINRQPKALNSVELFFSGIDTPDLAVSVIPADLPNPSFIRTVDNFNSLYFNSNQKHLQNISVNREMIPDSIYTVYIDALSSTLSPGIFSWAQIKKGEDPPLNYFFETGISIRGFVQKEPNQLHFDSSRVDIITKAEDSTTVMSTARVDQRGAFAVNEVDFFKRASVYISATTKEKKRRKISFDLQPAYIDTLSKIVEPFLIHPVLLEDNQNKAQQEDFIKKYSASGLGKELNEIIIQGKKISKEDSLTQLYASDLFHNTDFTIAPDTKFSYTTVFQMMQELIPGLYVSSAGAGDNAAGAMSMGLPLISFNRYTLSNDRLANGDGSSNSVKPVSVAFFLNEIPIDISELGSINPSDVILIKANRNPNLMTGNGTIGSGAEGSIMIYTKKQETSKLGFEGVKLTGYNVPFYFSQPNYEKSELQKIEDRRTTLLWYPNVKFVNGKATIQFYNNDYSKRFKVVIQGIDKNGNLYYLEKIIE